MPSGVTASFSPTSSASSSVLTLSVGSSVAAGNYAITITGTSGSLTATTVTTLTVTAQSSGSFTLASSASTLSVAQGASGTDTITVGDVNGFSGSVSFAASGMPSGVTASFSPTSSASSSVVTLSVGSSVTAGTYPITITGTSGSLTPTTSISLTVSSTGGGQSSCSGTDVMALDSGLYEFQMNEYDSSLQECATVSGTGFTITTANFNNTTSGSPANYTSIYNGCHWGLCTSSSPFPIEENNIASASSSVSITQPSGYADDAS